MTMRRSRRLHLYNEDNDDTGPKRTTGGASLLAPIALPPQRRPLLRRPRRPEKEHVPSALPHSCRLRILGDTTGLKRREGQRVSVLSCTSRWHMYTAASCGATSTSASTGTARCFPQTSATRSNAERYAKDTDLRRPKQATVREEAGVLIEGPP
jgi:hypothetical protein